MIAALYVDPRGPYSTRPGIDCWTKERNAHNYDGPWPVIAHPECGPWGALRQFCTLQDRMCGVHAVAHVRKWGGILEHPNGSTLWSDQRMAYPGCLPDAFGGITIEIDQVDWGHTARKRSWLYMVGITRLPPFPPPGKATAVIRPARNGEGAVFVPKSQRHITPPALVEWMVTAIDMNFDPRPANSGCDGTETIGE